MRQLTAAVATLPDYERSPANFFPLSARSVRIEDRPLPIIEIHVLAGPDQHRQRHAEIVMLSRLAFIERGCTPNGHVRWNTRTCGGIHRTRCRVREGHRIGYALPIDHGRAQVYPAGTWFSIRRTDSGSRIANKGTEMPSVLITGASRGLGLEFAHQYLSDGWRVLATCRNPTGAEKLTRLAKNAGDNLTILAIDVTKPEIIREAATQLDGVAIDLLINCAGITGASGQRPRNIDYDSWAQVFDVNTMGMRVLESFIGHIARSERRLVVSITSGMGSLGDNTSGGSIAYRSSKAALNMVMRSAAIDLAPQGISCVVINPGWVKTDMGGLNATLTPQESVSAIRQLITTLGQKDTGKFYHYDGGEYPW
jgi:NAD(P)-dependent dehydrogenase (short-subunit alcohol dehydrogenase family)